MKNKKYHRLLWRAGKTEAAPPGRKRRQYKYLYKKMLEEKTIRKAWKNLRKGKTKRPAVKAIDKNLDYEVHAMYLKILNTKPEGVEVENPELAYEPPKVRPTKRVNENKKKRTAHLAVIREQWYFHVIVEAMKPIVMKLIYKWSCGCVPGRGPHTGKKHIEDLIRDGKNVRCFFKGDIRHFYDNLRISVIIQQMRLFIADEYFLYCVAKIYKYNPKGIMIGLYISPWLANFALIVFDWKIENATGNKGLLIRYVDDIVIFAPSKKILWAALLVVIIELGALKLRLKRTWQICRFDYDTGKTKTVRGKEKKIIIGRPLDFMGFQFFRNRTLIRKRVLLSCTRQARKLKKAKEAGRRYYLQAVRGMVSRMGWFKYTDTYDCYLMRIKPYVNIKKLKSIVSKADKEVNKNDRLERGAQLQAA